MACWFMLCVYYYSLVACLPAFLQLDKEKLPKFYTHNFNFFSFVILVCQFLHRGETVGLGGRLFL